MTEPWITPYPFCEFPKGSTECIFSGSKVYYVVWKCYSEQQMLFLEPVQLYFRKKKKVLAGVKSPLTASDWCTGFQPGFFACAMTARRQRQQVSSLPVFTGFQTWSGHHPAVTNAFRFGGGLEALLALTFTLKNRRESDGESACVLRINLDSVQFVPLHLAVKNSSLEPQRQSVLSSVPGGLVTISSSVRSLGVAPWLGEASTLLENFSKTSQDGLQGTKVKLPMEIWLHFGFICLTFWLFGVIHSSLMGSSLLWEWKKVSRSSWTSSEVHDPWSMVLGHC